jgi:hypothetical protein
MVQRSFLDAKTVFTVLRSEEMPHCRPSTGKKQSCFGGVLEGVASGARTHDLQIHNLAL